MCVDSCTVNHWRNLNHQEDKCIILNATEHFSKARSYNSIGERNMPVLKMPDVGRYYI